MDLIGSIIRRTIVNKFVVIILQRIMTPSFVSLDIFSFLIVHKKWWLTRLSYCFYDAFHGYDDL